MFNVGGGEVLVILLVALLVLGPDKLPGAARTAGRVMRQVREVSSGFQDEVRRAMADDEPAAGAPAGGQDRTSAGSNGSGRNGDVHPGASAGPSLPPAAAAGAVDTTATSDDAAADPTPTADERSSGPGATWRTDGPSSSFT